MKKTLIAFLFLALTSGACASTFTASKDRTVYLTGVVSSNALQNARRIEQLSSKSTDDIDIIINSPGGYLTPGLQMISAMNVAQARGVTIRCFVPMLAASMAFQVLAECDKRYTLQYTALLWHPARASFKEGVKHDELVYYSRRLKARESILVRRLLEKMNITKKFFRYHFYHETMWDAVELHEKVPDFFEIVDNFENVKHPFSAR